MDLELVSLMIYLHRSCKLRLICILGNQFLATKFFSYVAHAITTQQFGRNSLFVCMSCWICFGENCRHFRILIMSDTHFEFIFTLQVRGPRYLGLTRSITWLLLPGLARSHGINNHGIDYKKGWSLSYLMNDFNLFVPYQCGGMTWNKYMYMLPLTNLTCKGLIAIVYSLFMSDKKYHSVSVKFISIRSLQSFSCNHLVKYWLGAKWSFPENWSHEWKTINAMVLCLLFTIPVHSATAFHHAAGAPNVIIHDLFQTA